MKNLGVFLLIIALIFAGLASFSVYKYLNNNTKEVKEIIEKDFYVANGNIEENTLITEKMIKVVKVPESFNISIYETKKENIINKFAYSNIINGEGFAKNRLISKEDNKLVVKLDKGERAATISITQYSAVADLLKPGDFVDIYVFLPEKIEGDIIVREDISKLLLQRIKILAIKQETSRNYENEEKIMDHYAITLAIKPNEVEKIMLGESIGRLKLALRPIEDNELLTTDGEVWKELLLNEDIEKKWLMMKKSIDEISDDDNPTENTEYDKYIVKYGDTLMNIARIFYNDEKKYTLIKEANGIGKNNLIITSEILLIPIIED